MFATAIRAPEFPVLVLAAAVAAPVLEDAPVPVAEALGEVAVDGMADVPDGGTTPEGMEVRAVVELEPVAGALALVVGALEGSPVTGTPWGRLMVVEGSAVSCGGSVFELDAALMCVDADADAVADADTDVDVDGDASVPMIVKGALMSPDEPNTAEAEGVER